MNPSFTVFIFLAAFAFQSRVHAATPASYPCAFDLQSEADRGRLTREFSAYLGLQHPAQENAIRNAESAHELLLLLQAARGYSRPSHVPEDLRGMPIKEPSASKSLTSSVFRKYFSQPLFPRGVPGLSQSQWYADYLDFVPGAWPTLKDVATRENASTRVFSEASEWAKLGHEQKAGAVIKMVVGATSVMASLVKDAESSAFKISGREIPAEHLAQLKKLFLGDDALALKYMVIAIGHSKVWPRLLGDIEALFPLIVKRQLDFAITRDPVRFANEFSYSPSGDESHRLKEVDRLKNYLLRATPAREQLSLKVIAGGYETPFIEVVPSHVGMIAPTPVLQKSLASARKISDELQALDPAKKPQGFSLLEDLHAQFGSAIAEMALGTNIHEFEKLAASILAIPAQGLRPGMIAPLSGAFDPILAALDSRQDVLDMLVSGLRNTQRGILVHVRFAAREVEALGPQETGGEDWASKVRKLTQRYEYQDMLSKVASQSLAMGDVAIQKNMSLVAQISAFRVLGQTFVNFAPNSPGAFEHAQAIHESLRALVEALKVTDH